MIIISAPAALDDILSVGLAKNLALVLCTTGYSEEEIANNTKGAHEAHNIKVDNFGAYSIVNLHVKVKEDMTLNEAHKIVHSVQNNIIKEIPEVKSVSVHACPLGLEYDHDQEIDN